MPILTILQGRYNRHQFSVMELRHKETLIQGVVCTAGRCQGPSGLFCHRCQTYLCTLVPLSLPRPPDPQPLASPQPLPWPTNYPKPDWSLNIRRTSYIHQDHQHPRLDNCLGLTGHELYSWLWFITTKDTKCNQQREKACGKKFRGDQAQATKGHLPVVSQGLTQFL